MTGSGLKTSFSSSQGERKLGTMMVCDHSRFSANHSLFVPRNWRHAAGMVTREAIPLIDLGWDGSNGGGREKCRMKNVFRTFPPHIQSYGYSPQAKE